MSQEQELKSMAWLEDNEIIYNQSTKDFKNKARKDRLFTDFGATIGLTGASIDRWYKSMRSSYGRIKKDFQKSGSATPVLKYRAAWIWKHLAFLRPHVRNKNPGVIMSRGTLTVQEGEDDEEDSEEVMNDDDEANSTVSSVVSSAVPSQSSHKDSTIKASGSTAKVRSSSSKGSKSTLDAALSEYLRKTAPEAANIQKEVQESLAALIQQRDHAAIWGESLANSARRLPFNLFSRFQVESLALVNRYLGMAERGDDPDKAQPQQQSFVQQLQMSPPQLLFQQQYPHHDVTWQPYSKGTPAPPMLQPTVVILDASSLQYTQQQNPDIPVQCLIPRDQGARQYDTTTSVGSVGPNTGTVVTGEDTLNTDSVLNAMVASPYSQDKTLDNEWAIE